MLRTEIEQSCIFCIDMMKAYNRVNLQFLWYKLEYFEFDKSLIQVLQSLYKAVNTMAVISWNRATTGRWELTIWAASL